MKLQDKAIEIVRNEVQTYQDPLVFVTDKVAFSIREIIKLARKNYWGIFDKPKDSQTGQDKIWVHLTQYLVDTIIKNIDLDTKDINFRAKNKNAIGLTSVIRTIVKNFMDNVFFGQDLDVLERDLSIDGTAVWKVSKEFGYKYYRKVDLLNVFIDPSVDSIQEAYRFTERGLMLPDEIKAMKGWVNTEDIEGIENIDRTEPFTSTGTKRSGKFVDVYEMWGKIPKYLITGNENDTEEVDGHIICSGILNAKEPRVHLIELNKNVDSKTGLAIKPYEEAWCKKVAGRWYGVGIPEMVKDLQVWVNTIVNTRIIRSRLSSLGIFTIRENRGLSPEMLTRLVTNGAIKVKDHDDIRQLPIQDVAPSTYTEEENAIQWAQRVSGAMEISTGEDMPSSMPATNAALQSRAAMSGFTMIKEGLGFFLQRLLKRHLVKLILKDTSKADIIRMTGKPEEVRFIDELYVNKLLEREIDKAERDGLFIIPEQVMKKRDELMARIQKFGQDRFVRMTSDIDVTEFDVQVFVTNEEIDKGVLSQNLLTMLQIMPESQKVIARQLFDIMGLNAYELEDESYLGIEGLQQFAQQQVPQEQVPQGGEASIPSQSPASAIMEANTM